MNSDQKFILLSSNSRKEYILDSLESIALPEGFIQHYRYALKWLDPNIKNFLQTETQGLVNHFIDQEIIIGMLYQTKTTNGYTWQKIIPIREAKLKFAYITGNSDDDVAHFYFRLGELIMPSKTFDEKIKLCFGEFYEKQYSKQLLFSDDMFIKSHQDSSIFNNLCNLIEKQKFYNDIPFGESGHIEYESPLFINIKSLKNTNEVVETPEYNNLTRKGCYKLCEGVHYALQFCSFADNKDNYTVSIKSDSKCFSTTEDFIYNINAKYDENAIDLIPRILNTKTRSIIDINIEKSTKKETLNYLDYEIPIYVSISPRFSFRFFDILADITFFITTITIALSKAFDTWPKILPPWFEIVIYAMIIWVISKFIVKLFWWK